jgi:hypothetical protein
VSKSVLPFSGRNKVSTAGRPCVADSVAVVKFESTSGSAVAVAMLAVESARMDLGNFWDKGTELVQVRRAISHSWTDHHKPEIMPKETPLI